MTREIKFRAWDRATRKFYEWKNFGFGNPNLWLTWATVVSAPEKYGVMQFTGLKDKNGKEIWEGDILRNNDYTWEVFYAGGAWRLVASGETKSDADHLLLLEERHSEVIGNVYQHPELLK